MVSMSTDLCLQEQSGKDERKTKTQTILNHNLVTFLVKLLQEFPEEGGVPTYYLIFYSCKLFGNEEILTRVKELADTPLCKDRK